MPVVKEDRVHGHVCKFYDGGVVKVGTSAARFTIKVPADEVWWFSTRLRAELIKRELVNAEELPRNEAGEAALTAKQMAVAAGTAKRAALKDAASSPQKRAAARLEAAVHHAALAETKRQLAESEYGLAVVKSKVAKVAPLVTDLAKELAALPKAKPALQHKMDAFMVRVGQLNATAGADGQTTT